MQAINVLFIFLPVDSCNDHTVSNPAPWHPPAPAGSKTHPHPILLLEGEGVADKDNSIRSLVRGLNEPRMREFGVPPCTRNRWVQAGGRVIFKGTSGSCRRGLHYLTTAGRQWSVLLFRYTNTFPWITEMQFRHGISEKV